MRKLTSGKNLRYRHETTAIPKTGDKGQFSAIIVSVSLPLNILVPGGVLCKSLHTPVRANLADKK